MHRYAPERPFKVLHPYLLARLLVPEIKDRAVRKELLDRKLIDLPSRLPLGLRAIMPGRVHERAGVG